VLPNRDLLLVRADSETVTIGPNYLSTRELLWFTLAKKFEKPGRYFHPLLGTLITGAARLMLALAEHQVTEQNLDWAFCDTDSIAIANTRNLSLSEFKATALKVRDWFKHLNHYGEDR
jgi:hypothetical protein